MRLGVVFVGVLTLGGYASASSAWESRHNYEGGNGAVGIATFTCGTSTVSNASEVANVCIPVGTARFVHIVVDDFSDEELAATWSFHAQIDKPPLPFDERNRIFCGRAGSPPLSIPDGAAYLSVQVGPAGLAAKEKVEACGAFPGTFGTVHAYFSGGSG